MPYYIGYPSVFLTSYNHSGFPPPWVGYDYHAHDDDKLADAYEDDSGYADAYEGGSRYASGYNARAVGSGMAESFPSSPPQYSFPGLRLRNEGAEKPKTGPPLPPAGRDFFDELPRPGVSRASSTLAPLGSGWRPQSDAGHSVVPPSEKPKSVASQKPALPKTPRASRAPSVRPETPPLQATYPPTIWADFGVFDTPRELTEVPRGLNEILDSCNGLPDPDKIIEFLREARRCGRNPLPLPDGLDMSFTHCTRHGG